MGPRSRYLGPEVPEEELIWQDPVPAVDHTLVDEADIRKLKARILDSGLTISECVSTAWASASTFRGSDMRGGANGARIRLEPQRNWEVNKGFDLEKVLDTLETLQKEFTSEQSGDKKISLADLIVLAGCAAVEKAASRAGVEMTVPFSPGRTDATAAQTDVQAFSVLEPKADGFRNYQRSRYGTLLGPLLLDNAQLLTLTAPEMVALRGGLRVLNANYRQVQHGVLTDRPEVLTNDFFTNILDMRTAWTESKIDPDVYEGRDRSNGTVRWTATRVDLLFGSHSQLRALAEVYGSSDAEEKFVRDFVSVWNKVMNLDRFDLADRG